MPMHKIKLDITDRVREPLIAMLNQRLADTIDTKMQAKQAHWNVKGMSFVTLHELFDRVATELDELAEQLALRTAALGGTVIGTIRYVHARSTQPPYPENIYDGAKHVDALSTSLAELAEKIRSDVEVIVEIGDPNTEDLFIAMSRQLDKLLWLVEAHQTAG